MDLDFTRDLKPNMNQQCEIKRRTLILEYIKALFQM